MADEVKKEGPPQTEPQEAQQKESQAAPQPAPRAAKTEPKKEEPKAPTLEDIIKEKDRKIAELNDKYLRALAEMDNFRKRVSRDKEDFVKYARSETVSVFLPVVDNFERALTATEKTKDYDDLKKGIDMVLKQFEHALKEMHVKEVPVNKQFDPDMHHAVHKEHRADKKDGEILEVYQKGYMIDDRVIRAAMVKVAVFDAEAKKTDEKKQGE
ncbi:MAG: nucleotide exchange factor GrpE [Spirochaetia bacterium]|nr:nucleotide exchange factor GrpE [Spirochaetia bacterium]